MSAVSTMPEHPLYHLQLHPGSQRQSGGAVAQVVEPDRRHIVLSDQFLEHVGEPTRGDRATVEVGEHIPAVAIPLTIGRHLGLLPGAVHAQRRDRGAVQRDHRMLCAVLGGHTVSRPSLGCSSRQITAVPLSRSKSHQRSPAASPRRSPRSAIRW